MPVNKLEYQMQQEQLNSKLKTYLSIYVKKRDLKMKPVINSMLERINNNVPITKKQFNSVIRFLEREREFSNLNQNQIKEIFKPVIQDCKPTPSPEITLDHFF